jgi:hypothetical protein
VKLRGRATARARLWVVPAAASLLLLTGCSDLTPGTAAVVNGTRISNRSVDRLSDAQCTLRQVLSKSNSAPAASFSRVKQESLSLLMDAQLSNQFGKSKDIEADPVLTAGFLNQVLPVFKPLPKKSRDEFIRVFRVWSKGRAILVQAGGAASGQQPTSTNLDQLVNAGLQARASWLKKADIDTDARYAPDKDGFPGGGQGSISQAGSTFAKDAAKSTQDAKWVEGLPSAQKCG